MGRSPSSVNASLPVRPSWRAGTPAARARHHRLVYPRRARATGVPARQLGLTGGDALTLEGERPILVAKLSERFEGWFPAYMAGAAA